MVEHYFSKHKIPYNFAVIYRHHHNNHSQFYDAFDESFQMLNRCNKNVFIMGNVNIHMCSHQYSLLLYQYLETLYSNEFTCCINKPTRIASSSQTAIDHIITNIVKDEITPGISKFHISDHLPIFCSISSLLYIPPIIKINTTYRNINNVEEDVFRHDLHYTLEPIVYEFTNLPITSTNFDTHFNNLIANIEAVIDKHAPMKTVSRKWRRFSENPWVTRGIITSIKHKQKLYRTYFLTGNAFKNQFFKKYANKLTRVKKLSKKMYYTEYISKHNPSPKKVWQIINSLIPRKTLNSFVKNINVDNKFVDHPSDIAEEFNTYVFCENRE